MIHVYVEQAKKFNKLPAGDKIDPLVNIEIMVKNRTPQHWKTSTTWQLPPGTSISFSISRIKKSRSLKKPKFKSKSTTKVFSKTKW
jgi:long-subunit fatty acid transport protein